MSRTRASPCPAHAARISGVHPHFVPAPPPWRVGRGNSFGAEFRCGSERPVGPGHRYRPAAPAEDRGRELCEPSDLSVGNVITIPVLIVQQEFPSSAFGLVIGLSTAVGALAPAVLDAVRDVSGDYTAALTLCVALQLSGAALVLLPPRR